MDLRILNPSKNMKIKEHYIDKIKHGGLRMIQELDGYCPNCGMNSIMADVDEFGNIFNEYCAICGYFGVGIEIYTDTRRE